MKKLSVIMLNVILFGGLPGIVGAAGTYYNTGSYQQRYGTNNGGYYNSYPGGARPAAMPAQTYSRAVQRTQSNNNNGSYNSKQGFQLGADLSHQMANWKFDMKNIGSSLHYDDLHWNVLGINAVYYFGDSTPMQIKVGANYGVQFDESTMADDDVTKGGIVTNSYPLNDGSYVYQTSHALSLGTSKDGKQMGFNVSFGFTDAFVAGRVKFTPSIGYRYFRYEVQTKKNFGASIDIAETESESLVTCYSFGDSDEVLCDPFLLWINSASGESTFTGRNIDADGLMSDFIDIPDGVDLLSLGGTMYTELPGTSHKYDTVWSGPYVSLDMEYEIDRENSVVAGVELGLPIYTSEGDQPYRTDWAHPTSVKDEGSFGDAIHLGLNAMWTTMIGETTSLSFGFTYDYYKVSDATATTFLNAAYYEWLYETYDALYDTETRDWLKNSYAAEMQAIDKERALGWELKDDNEIESVYKSMGIRVGINVKF